MSKPKTLEKLNLAQLQEVMKHYGITAKAGSTGVSQKAALEVFLQSKGIHDHKFQIDTATKLVSGYPTPGPTPVHKDPSQKSPSMSPSIAPPSPQPIALFGTPANSPPVTPKGAKPPPPKAAKAPKPPRALSVSASAQSVGQRVVERKAQRDLKIAKDTARKFEARESVERGDSYAMKNTTSVARQDVIDELRKDAQTSSQARDVLEDVLKDNLANTKFNTNVTDTKTLPIHVEKRQDAFVKHMREIRQKQAPAFRKQEQEMVTASHTQGKFSENL